MDENIPFCFLNIYKPKGITSFDVIYKLRKKLNIKKIGHSGTLDPMADGVMQVGAGSASRLIEYLNSDKEYIAQIKFGYKSTTLDMEGEITKVDEPKFGKEELITVLKDFLGEIEQIPPLYSAIKVNGKKLCDEVRKNPDIKITPPKRKVKIYNIELLDFDHNMATIKVFCSKGTYIRTLAKDIANKLNTDAYLTKLTRTKAGNFEIANSIKTDDVDINKDKINPKDVINLPETKLNNEEYNLIKNGNKIKTKDNTKDGLIMLTYNNKLVSIAKIADNIIKVEKNFI